MNNEMKESIIPLKKDFMFSQIFNKEENVSKLEKFVAGYYGFPYEKVKGHLKLYPRDLRKNAKKEAKKQVDLLLELEKYRMKINIEVESKFWQAKKDRNTVYLAKISSSNYIKGDIKLQHIWKSKQINFSLKNGSTRDFIEEYFFRDGAAKEIYTEVMQIDRVNVERIHDLDYEKLNEKEKVTYDFCMMLEATTEESLKNRSKFLMNERDVEDLVKQVSELSGDEEMMILDSEYTDEELEYNTFMAYKEELNQEQKSLNQEQKSLKRERKLLKKEQESLRQEQDCLKQEQDSLKQEQDCLKQEQDRFHLKQKEFIQKLLKFGIAEEEIMKSFKEVYKDKVEI